MNQDEGNGEIGSYSSYQMYLFVIAIIGAVFHLIHIVNLIGYNFFSWKYYIIGSIIDAVSFCFGVAASVPSMKFS